MRIKGLFAALGAACMMAGCQAVPPPAPTFKNAVQQTQASHFQGDFPLPKPVQTGVRQSEGKAMLLRPLETDGRRRFIVYLGDCSALETFAKAILADVIRRGEVFLIGLVSRFLPPGVKVPDPRHEPRVDGPHDWEYSDFGLGLLGHVVARAAGVETISELIRLQVVRPLEMSMAD